MSDYSRYPVWRQSSPSSVWEPSPSSRPPRVCIVTDSASDILPSHARAIGVMVIPSWLIMDGARLRDGVDITASHTV